MLHVHRSDRADGLIEALRALLAEPPDDPFAAEVVAVPTRGMERWLTQRLSAVLVVGVTGLELLGVESWVEQVFNGVALAVAVAFARLVSSEQAS